MGIDETRLIRIHAEGGQKLSLGVLHKRATRIDPRLPPVLLIHGATFGASIFDLPRVGYSLMSDLAARGRAVYALDVRGYGNSPAPSMPAAEPGPARPFPLLTDVIKDIGAAVAVICDRDRTDSVDLAGFSWGAMTSARYAAEHPRQVARLALYAPIYCEVNRGWLRRIADPNHPDRIHSNLGAYRLITLADVIERWDLELGSGDPKRYRDSGLPELLFEAMAPLDRVQSNGRPAFRCPTGALVDMLSAFNGRPVYDPAALTMATLIIRGADDTTSTDSDAVRLLAAITSDDKDYRTIAPGSHFLLVERSRGALYEQLARFFERGRR